MNTEISIEIIDYILIVFVGLILPVLGQLLETNNRLKEKMDALSSDAIYYTNTLLLWTPTLIILGLWLMLDRPLASLGLTFEHSFGSYCAFALAIGGAIYCLVDYWRVKTNPKKAEETLKDFQKLPEDFLEVLPKTKKEFRGLSVLAITAGITEEILYRAFLIWGFSLFVNIWIASLLAIVSFTIGHLYQKTIGNLMRVAGIAVIVTTLYMISGSIIPSIIVHIIIDIAAVANWWQLKKQGLTDV